MKWADLAIRVVVKANSMRARKPSTLTLQHVFKLTKNFVAEPSSYYHQKFLNE